MMESAAIREAVGLCKTAIWPGICPGTVWNSRMPLGIGMKTSERSPDSPVRIRDLLLGTSVVLNLYKCLNMLKMLVSPCRSP